MYYNAERNQLAVMKETENLFPIKHTCDKCFAEFSFTSLDDFGVGKRDHYEGVYSTLALYAQDVYYKCPSCKTARWLSPKQASSEYELNNSANYTSLENKLKTHVIRYQTQNKKTGNNETILDTVIFWRITTFVFFFFLVALLLF